MRLATIKSGKKESLAEGILMCKGHVHSFPAFLWQESMDGRLEGKGINRFRAETIDFRG